MTDTPRWSADDIPDLAGLRAVVTGANSGLGLQTALELARHGAFVTLACRDQARGDAAVARVRSENIAGTAHLAILDLADLGSVRRFAASWQGPLDILVANAGVMAVPRGTTADGFERQLGTNHLGHFALTGLLLPALQQGTAARVVSVSSNAHKFGRINFDDLQSERHYSRWGAYGQSKLANLLFIREFTRRLALGGSRVIAAAAHPGTSATALTDGFTGSEGLRAVLTRQVNRMLARPDTQGALPSLYAATMPDVAPGDYFGPGASRRKGGSPVRVGMTARARDGAVAERLWSVSQELTGVTYDLPG